MTDIEVVNGSGVNGNGTQQYDEEYDGGNSTARLFERTRIQVLADERETVQKKTFAKWINSHLIRVGYRIQDLYIDLRDGRVLLKLLEILSGDDIPKATRGKMRIHCLENVDKALQFLQDQHVHLENIGAHDIVDGNSSLTLGLIWTIILRFQIQDITIEAIESKETRSAKDALLLWCQIKTADYQNVNIRNFSTSWRDGLAFNALIHKHRSDLIQYQQLNKTNPMYNLNNAFTIAEKFLGITRLLDAEDVNVEYPDEKSIITYVVAFYHFFSKMKADFVQGKRINKVLANTIQFENDISGYESLTSNLLKWIDEKIQELSNRQFPNSLEGVKKQLNLFNLYRINEKAQKFTEKGNLEMQLFTIQSRMRANNQKPFTPRDGKLISDINKAWCNLEKSEHEHELALREEIVRQENLEQLAAKFNKKAAMRKKWLNDSQKLIVSDQFFIDLDSMDASLKKQEAIQTDIGAFESRVRNVFDIAQVLEKENYYDLDKISATKRNVLLLWNYLLDLVQDRRHKIDSYLNIQQLLNDCKNLHESLVEIRSLLNLNSTNHGCHLMSVLDLKHRHLLLKSELDVLGQRVQNINENIQHFLNDSVNDEGSEGGEVESSSSNVVNKEGGVTNGNSAEDKELIRKRIEDLNNLYNEVVDLAKTREERLSESYKYWLFSDDLNEEQFWLMEKQTQLNFVNSQTQPKNDLEFRKLLYIPNIIGNEMDAHRSLQLQNLYNQGNELVEQNNYNAEQIKQKLADLDQKWKDLESLIGDKQDYLNNLEKQQQFFTDCDDCDTWMIERGRLLTSYDLINDQDDLKESNLLNLIKKHRDLHDDFENYKQYVDGMHSQSEQLVIVDGDENVREKVQQRLAALDRRYNELLELCRLKKAKLNDSLQICRLNTDVDNVAEWIDEKERFLNSIDTTQVRDIEELEVIKHRFDGFERDMNTIAPNIGLINQQTRQLLTSQEAQIADIEAVPAPAHDIHEKVNSLNQKWSSLRKLVDKKRDDLQSTFGVQTFVIESNETIRWIEEKIKIVQSTQEFGNDLTGVMNMQRRLSSLERDMAAIQSKLTQLESQGSNIEKDHPEDHARINDKLSEIKKIWSQFTDILRVREESMGEAAELQKFLRDLDHFSLWLTKTQKQVASDDQPQSLSDAEHLLNQHQNIKEEIDRYAPDYARMREYGQHVINQPEFGNDSQYIFFVERLNALDKGWDELDEMWRQKQSQLSEQLNLKMFERDVKQVEVLLNNQEYYLSKQDEAQNLDDAENLIRKHEDFITSVKANEDKIEGIKQFASRLCDDGHPQKDKIREKSEEIDERFTFNKQKASTQLDSLRDSLEYYQYLQDCDELKEWLDSKYNQAKDDKYRDTKDIHMKYMRHKAFEAEIQANHNRVDELERNAVNLANDKPELRDDLMRRLSELQGNWSELQVAIKDKGEKLFDANRSQLYDQSVDSIDGWLKEMEKHIQKTSSSIQSTDGKDEVDLTTTNILLEKQREIESQLLLKQRQVDELKEQAVQLKETEPDRSEDIDLKRVHIQDRFSRIMQPLEEQRRQLEAQKRVYQFIRDCEDEQLWIDEKSQLAQSTDYGSSLVNVKMFQRKNDALQIDVENHDARIQQVCNDGDAMVQEDHPRSEEFKQLIGNLQEKWDALKRDIDARRRRLDDAEKIQQYLFDCSELEAWIGEQELYMLQDDQIKDELNAQIQLKKHQTLENEIEDHSLHIRQLDDVSRGLLNENQGNDVVTDLIMKRQANVNKLYAGLKQLANDKHLKLDDSIKLYLLKRDIDDLEQWINDKETVANSQELGQDFEHVNLLRERFDQFKQDTQQVGNERVQYINEKANLLIDCEHQDSALIAQWKDELNVSWTDLLELIETRTQLLLASWELHKFFNDCKECLAQIDEKKQLLSDDFGRDAQSVAQLQRKHSQFENDLLSLGGQVHQIRENCSRLQVSYAGDKSTEINGKEQEVINEWRNLQRLIDIRKRQLADTGDLYKFFNMSRDLCMWMDGIISEMKNDDKPRDVSGVELLMNNHHSLKAEIDARAENFTICINLGKDLINRRHPRSLDVKERCVQLCLQRDETSEQWDERWEHLQLMLEVYQFARDASVAEQWLIAQEPYLQNEDLGDTLDQVENLIKKHEVFEKSISAQEDRFNALKKLTTLELRKQQPTNKEKVQRRPLYEEEFRTLDERDAENQILQERLEKQRQEDELRKRDEDKNRTTVDSPDGSKRQNEAGTSRLESANEPHQEGLLTRKHEWESVNRKASNRSWDKFYCVLNGSRFEFYKDQKHYKSHKGLEISLNGASVEEAVDYKKKDHVFRLRLGNGGQYLFRAKDDDEMNLWINKINNALGVNPNDIQNKTKSLPIQRHTSSSTAATPINNNNGANTLASSTLIQSAVSSGSLKKDNTSSPKKK